MCHCIKYRYTAVSAGCEYLLVEIAWSSQSARAVADAGQTAADWDTIVFGFFKPAGVPPVRIVVNATAMKLAGEYQEY